MKFKFKYRNTAFEYWQLAMYYTYGSIVGICNIIFTAAMIALTVRFWTESSSFVRLLLLLACGLFTVFQPLYVYLQSKEKMKAVQQEIELSFDDKGIYVKSGEKTEQLSWKRIKKVSKKPGMIIIFSDTVHGYVLSSRVLGKEKEEFYAFVVSKAGS